MIVAHTQDYLVTPSITKLVEHSILGLLEKQGVINFNQLTRSTRIKRQAKAPPAISPYFVVRKEGWEIMQQKLLGSRLDGLNVFVISGMGGCGKTQLVSYFVQIYQARFKYIFFIDASSESSIKTDLRNAIQSIDVHYQGTEEALFFLQRHVQSLMIFDNADDPNLNLVQFFPNSYRGIIIITSRLRTLGELSTLYHLQLGEMSHDEAVETLVKAARRSLPLETHESEAVDILVEELGCLALALVQAGVYTFNSGSIEAGSPHESAFGQYLELFRRERASLMRRPGAKSLDNYEQGVYPTLDLSYTLLPGFARELLHLCSQFHYTDISLAMLIAAANGNFEDSRLYLERPDSHRDVLAKLRALFRPHGVVDEIHTREMIQSLSSFSLVQTTLVNETILLRFHPLVHAWSHEILSAGPLSIYSDGNHYNCEL